MSADRARPATVIRKDANGEARPAPDWETHTERLIREAQEAGEFDDLPATGRTFERDDDGLAGDMSLAFRVLRNAGGAPPWIEADKTVRRTRHRIEALMASIAPETPAAWERVRVALDDLLDEEAVAVSRLNAAAPTDRQHRRRLDRDAVHRRLRGSGRSDES